MEPSLFSDPGFMPHIHCYLGSAPLVWTMFVTDLIIGIAYVGIALILWLLARRIKIAFSPIILCFGIFIAACGGTHFMDVLTLWYPAYWLSAAVKVVTALASVGTGIYLFRLRHHFVSMAEAAKLSEQRRAQLESLNQLLEQKVEERTKEAATNNSLFEAVFEQAAVGMIITDLKTRKIVRVNKKFCDMVGYTPDELTRLTASDITFEGDKSVDQEVFKQMMAGSISAIQFEKRFIHKKGNVVWCRVAGGMILDSDGKASHAAGVMQDITSEKAAIEAYKISESRFHALADNMSQLAWMADETGSIHWYNKRWYEYTGTTPEEMLGWGWFKVHKPDLLEGITERFRISIERGEPWEDTFPLRSKNGEWRWFLSRALPIKDETTGKITNWFGTNTDITERMELLRRIEEQLSELTRSNTELKRFAYVASHDLSEPLRAIISYSQLLQTQYLGKPLDENGQEYLGFVVGAGKRMHELIEDLLQYSRLNGTHAETFKPVDCDSLFEDTLVHLKPVIEKTRAQIIKQNRLPTVLGSASQLSQVCQNLVSNSLKFRHDDQPPRVEISSRDMGDVWEFTFADNGIGIPEQHLGSIFTIFKRIHSREKYPGTGVGLAIVKQIIENHGGKIHVESKLGQGAKFIFSLPKA